MATSKVERLMNLVIALLSTDGYLPAERIRRNVAGYAESPSDEAFSRMFERDKNELRDLGIPLETGRVSALDPIEGYRINRDAYALPEIDLTPDEARRILDSVRLDDKRDAHASSLPHGDQRKLEVALLMALDPKVYMFDEPTAGMSVDEVPVVLDLIRALRSRRDRLILLVEHKMDVVRELADRIIVLHNGALVADGEPAAVIASPVVQQAYLGVVPEDEDGLAPVPADRREPTGSQRHAGRDVGAA